MNHENCPGKWILSFFYGLCEKSSWFPPLLARITVGVIFFQAGWGKLHHLQKVIGFFTQLGIPAPNILAPFVAGVEFTCGILILVGLLTRFVSVPLIGIMIVAILTAKMKEISDISDLFGLIESLSIVLLVWLAIAGAGAVSIDHILCSCCRRKK